MNLKKAVTPTIQYPILILIIERLAALILILAPFHAFLTLWVSQLTGHFVLVRLWDEALAVGIVSACLYLMWKLPDLRRRVFRSWFFRLTFLYIVTTFLIGLLSLFKGSVVPQAFGYAVIVNLRFLAWLFSIFVISSYSPWLKNNWKKLVFIPLSLVVVFGLLQFFILPTDFLKHFGYNDTYAYVATVPLNQDSPIMRIQSFLRGANPLGAYLAMCLPLMLATFWAAKKRSLSAFVYAGLVSLALVLTFSRSAFLGFVTSLVVLGWFIAKRWRKAYSIIVSCTLLAACALVLISLQHGGFKNMVLHTNDATTAEITSNEGHASSARLALTAFLEKPLFGHGPGSAGAASWYNTRHPIRNTESFLLQIFVELGLFGAAIFAGLLVVLYRNLLQTIDDDGLSLGIIATLVGALVINLFSYGWTDDTLAYVWWGLAGIALGNTVLHSSRQSLGRSGININRWLSAGFDKYFIPKNWRIDGMKDYVQVVVPPLAHASKTIYDVGGGKRPFIGSEMPASKGQKVIGIDIDKAELARAPKKAYFGTIVADIGTSKGIQTKFGKADLVICEAVLEHVQDNDAALANIVALTKPGGHIALFVPARNAAFAVINRILPERIKRRLLFSIFPESAHAQGFPAYYHKCTPSQFKTLCESNGLEVTLLKPYYQSTYFSFFFPAHVLWRVYQVILFGLLKKDAAESFTLIAKKK